jgi:hypothetical protein
MTLDFDTWKAEYQPRVYEDTGAECDEHGWECECEFLYTVNLDELEDEDANAVAENRIWTWMVGGEIVSGIQKPGWDFLITKKPYNEEIVVK